MPPDPVDEILRASSIAQRARDLASNALSGAEHCDEERARRLEEQSRQRIDKARRILGTVPADALDLYATDDITRRILDTAEDLLARIDAALEECLGNDDRVFQPGGTFSGSLDLQEGQAGQNRIEFVFGLNGEVQCHNLCIVSVFHIEEDRTGTTIIPPSRGYTDEYDPLIGGRLRDEDSVDGYVVDTPPRVLVDGRLVNNTSPCLPTMEIQGDVITAWDSPSFLRQGHTAYFETCVLCLDGEPFAILGCMRWKHTPGRSEIQPGENGEIDRETPSGMFEEAVRIWRRNHQ